MNKDLIITILSIAAFMCAIFGLYRYRKDLLFKIALKYVQEAEDYFGSKSGKEKLAYVAEKIRQVTPWWIDPMITDELVTKIINEVVDYLQDTFKSSKEKQIAAVNEIVKLADTNYNVTQSAKTVLDEIDKKGYVEAYAEVKSDLSGNHNAQAGVRAGMKF